MYTAEELAASMNAMLEYGRTAEEVAADPAGALGPFLDEYVRIKRLQAAGLLPRPLQQGADPQK